ncbi:MAG: hypothetical protein LBQ47_00390, partial [Endomicrobium sp.]|nr:hypothetical protein [Endomicrobium sp.]
MKEKIGQYLKKAAGLKDKAIEGIRQYFQEYWKRNRFMKTVSMIVLVCFIINILNLPAFSATQEDAEKINRTKQNLEQNVVMTGSGAGAVNQSVSIDVNAAGAAGLSAQDIEELSAKNITVNEFGNVMQEGSDRIIANVDEKGRVTVFGPRGEIVKDEKVIKEWQSRVDQYKEQNNGQLSGGGYKKTTYVEDKPEEKRIESRDRREVKAEDRRSEDAQKPGEGQVRAEELKEVEEISGEIKKDEDAAEEVKSDKSVEDVNGPKINEESGENKQAGLQQRLRKNIEDEASVTNVTIAKVQENAAEEGINLIAVRGAPDGVEQIALYQNENG